MLQADNWEAGKGAARRCSGIILAVDRSDRRDRAGLIQSRSSVSKAAKTAPALRCTTRILIQP